MPTFAERRRANAMQKHHRRDRPMLERILALLAQVTDESLLESIYWYIERKVMRTPPTEQ